MFIINRQVFVNFFSLSTVNLINLVLPFIVIPWLLHVLGVELYGQVALYQYVGQFVLMFVDFGFPIYCVREVASRIGDRHELAGFIGSVFFLKILLSLFVVFVFVLVVLLQDFFIQNEISLSLLAGFIFVGALSSFYPSWFFQGLEKMHAMIIPTIVGKVAVVFFIFVMVKRPEHVYWVPVAYGIGALLHNFFAIKILFAEAGIPHLQQRGKVKKILLESAQVFWSRLAIAY